MVILLLKGVGAPGTKGEMSGIQFTRLLDACFARMGCTPQTGFLKRTLIIAVMAAFEVAPGTVAAYLERSNLWNEFITIAR